MWSRRRCSSPRTSTRDAPPDRSGSRSCALPQEGVGAERAPPLAPTGHAHLASRVKEGRVNLRQADNAHHPRERAHATRYAPRAQAPTSAPVFRPEERAPEGGSPRTRTTLDVACPQSVPRLARRTPSARRVTLEGLPLMCNGGLCTVQVATTPYFAGEPVDTSRDHEFQECYTVPLATCETCNGSDTYDAGGGRIQVLDENRTPMRSALVPLLAISSPAPGAVWSVKFRGADGGTSSPYLTDAERERRFPRHPDIDPIWPAATRRLYRMWVRKYMQFPE